jgi:hypothetical protein
MWFGDLGVASDTRQMISADVAASGFVKAGGAWGTEVTVAVAARPASNLELDANADAGTDLRARRFYDCTTPEGHACTVETPMRGYHFASLDSAFASFTMRGTYTLSTRLSLQGTSQLFLSRGAYHSFMDIETIGANPYIRFAEMTPSSYLGDANGNGVPDANFAEAALNAQVLLRWEPTRGASVYLAYNRRERAAPTDVPARRLEPGRLAEARVEELIFLKWVHYISL